MRDNRRPKPHQVQEQHFSSASSSSAPLSDMPSKQDHKNTKSSLSSSVSSQTSRRSGSSSQYSRPAWRYSFHISHGGVLARHAGSSGGPSWSISSSSSSSASKLAKDNNEGKSTALVVSQDQLLPYRDPNRDFEEVSSVFWENKYHDIKKIIWDYSFDPMWFRVSFRFFRSSLKQEILALVHHAAPLDVVARYVRRAHARREAHLPVTLVQATVQAIRNLDVTILDKNVEVIAEGMAERLLGLHAGLFPEMQLGALQQIRAAIGVENEREKKAREAANVAVMKELFDVFVKNDETAIAAAIKNFQEFVSHSTQLNRLHLLIAAFDELARRGRNLPIVNAKDCGGMYGALADRFRFEVIGGLEKVFSPWMQKILAISVYYILNRDKEALASLAARQLDIDAVDFLGARGSNRELAVNFFYDEFGLRGPSHCAEPLWMAPVVGRRCFQNLLRAITSGIADLCSDPTLSRRATP